MLATLQAARPHCTSDLSPVVQSWCVGLPIVSSNELQPENIEVDLFGEDAGHAILRHDQQTAHVLADGPITCNWLQLQVTAWQEVDTSG